MTSQWPGPEGRCYVIAELGVNHNGDMELARRLIDVAADAGADAVKFQTFFAEDLVTPTAEKAVYQKANDGAAGSQYEMLKRLELTEDEYAACKQHCDARGIAFLSTPFGRRPADLLEALGVNGFKVSSGDLTHLPFLAYLAEKGLPLIISTGMADMAETEAAVRTIEAAGDPPLAILHCVSNYPAVPGEANLKAMDTISAAFGKPVGWSDHTEGDAIALAAIARGARILEKHYTLDRALPGPDHKASLEPQELTDLIGRIRDVEAALGDGIKRPQPSELETAKVARRSIVAAAAVRAGEVISESKIAYRRPGTGLPPAMARHLIGRKAARDISENTVLSFSDFGE